MGRTHCRVITDGHAKLEMVDEASSPVSRLENITVELAQVRDGASNKNCQYFRENGATLSGVSDAHLGWLMDTNSLTAFSSVV
jgi:hypothetical protein